MSNLNPQQFTAYRGLYLGGLQRSHFVQDGGIGHFENAPRLDPEDTEAILREHLRQNPHAAGNPNAEKWSPYGTHWTPHEDTAWRFAHDPSHGHHNYVRPSPEGSYGLVLEAHTSQPVQRNAALSRQESQVDVPRSIVTGITAHLHRHDGGRLPRDPRQTLVRSFPVPEEHWRNS